MVKFLIKKMDTNESGRRSNIAQPETKESRPENNPPKQNSSSGFIEPGNQSRNQEAIDIETEKPAREGKANDSENIETGGPDKPTA